MRKLHITPLVLTLTLLVLTGIGTSPQFTQAQDNASSCLALYNVTVEGVAGACDTVGPDEACYGTSVVEATLLDETDPTFAAPGDAIALADVTTLTTGAAAPNDEQWGVAVLNIHSNLPEDATDTITMILFGDAALTNLVDPNAEAAPTITLQNSAGYPVNLRGGGGTNYPTTGSLEENISILADGRNEAGDWYRLQTPDGPAWVFRDLVTIADGDVEALNVLAVDDVSQTFTAPLQAITLQTNAAESVCGAGAAGLLIQLTGENTAQLRINGVDLSFAEATLLIQAPAEDAMDIMVLDGEASVKVNGSTANAPSNSWLELTLDGESQPLVHQAYSFASVSSTPVDLLPGSMTCTTGLLTTGEGPMLFTGPGEVYTPLAPMDAELHYTILGQNVDDEGTPYWLVDVAGYARAWIEQEAVPTMGLCGNIEEITPPPVNAVASQTGGSSLVPAGQSVWQTDPGLDSPSGTCNEPAMALCAHLAAITPNADGSIQWRGQDINPYTLYSSGSNNFSYNGRNALNNGNVNMNMTFLDESNWIMTMNIVFDSDPACTHTLNYTAIRNW